MSHKHTLRDVIDCCIWPNDGPRLQALKPEGVPQQPPVERAPKGVRAVVVPVEALDGTSRGRIFELLASDGGREMSAPEIAAHLGINRVTVSSRLTKMRDEEQLVEVVDVHEIPWRWRVAPIPAHHAPLPCGCDHQIVCRCAPAEAAE